MSEILIPCNDPVDPFYHFRIISLFMGEGAVCTGFYLFFSFKDIMKSPRTVFFKIQGTIAEEAVYAAFFAHFMAGIILTLPVFKIFKTIHDYGIIIHLKQMILQG